MKTLPKTMQLIGERALLGRSVAHSAGVAVEASETHDSLSAGYHLDEFKIVRVLGAGGFGIVYLALDQVLLRYVAIKEYFPSTLASRSKNSQVAVRSKQSEVTFVLGLESFINEARLLASFDHPSLVKVHRFWKQNGTAYMVMQYYPGQTLKAARHAMSEPPDETWLRAFVDPLLGALETLHAQGVFHRDIAPDNILLLPNGQPVVLDFGSARRVIGDRTQSLTAVLKPNFSPVEQYAEDAGMRQGAYTDLFALGGTVRFMLTGEAPTPAVMRAVRDTLPALSRSDAGSFSGVSSNFLATIDWTLALAPADRPQTVDMLRQALNGAAEPPAASARHLSAGHGDSAPFGPTAALAKTEVYPKPLPEPSPIRTATLRHGDVPSSVQSVAGRGLLSHRPSGPRVGAMVLALAGIVVLAWVGLSRFDEGALAAANPVPFSSTTRSTDAVPEVPATSTAVAAPKRASEVVGSANDRRVEAATSDGATAMTLRGGPVDRPVNSTASIRTASPPTPTAPLPAIGACASLGFFAKLACVSRVCQSPALEGAPQCVESRRIDDQRQRRMDQ